MRIFLMLAILAQLALQGADNHISTESLAASKNEADRAWNSLISPPIMRNNDSDQPHVGVEDDPVAAILRQEKEKLRIRTQGLEFFEKFGSDARRWEWLNFTLQDPPLYFIDGRRDATAFVNGRRDPSLYDERLQSEWDLKYAQLRAVCFSSPDSAEIRPVILLNEIKELIERLEAGQHMEVAQLISRVWDYTTRPDSSDPVRLVNELLSVLNERHLRAERNSLVTTMKVSPSAEVQEWALGQDRVMAMQANPVKLTLKGLDGTEINLEKLRDKVVLVDGWSIWCSSCIEALPQIKAIYDKYEPNGFEVVGICFVTDAKRDEAKSIKVIRDKAPDWPIALLRDEEAKAFMSNYGIKTMPVMWLIGRDGKLISSEYLGHVELEARVRELIGLPLIDGTKPNSS